MPLLIRLPVKPGVLVRKASKCGILRDDIDGQLQTPAVGVVGATLFRLLATHGY